MEPNQIGRLGGGPWNRRTWTSSSETGLGWAGLGRVDTDRVGEGNGTFSLWTSAVIKSCWLVISWRSMEDLLSIDWVFDECLCNSSSSCSWLKRMERTSSTILGAEG